MSRRHEALFVISVAARLSGMHPQTLRIYERRGLVAPYRTEGGTRRYSQQDIDRLLLISELTSAGLNLEGVKMVMALQDEISAIRKEHRKGRRQLELLASTASRAAQMEAENERLRNKIRELDDRLAAVSGELEGLRRIYYREMPGRGTSGNS
jgi:MerR family transcriptional regulator/heat shock protein HspR